MLSRIIKLSNRIDCKNCEIADKLDRLILGQTTPIDVRILELQKAIETVRRERGDQAEIQALLQEIMRLRRQQVGTYMPIR